MAAAAAAAVRSRLFLAPECIVILNVEDARVAEKAGNLAAPDFIPAGAAGAARGPLRNTVVAA